MYFSNDSSFVYALGYPASTWFQHLARLAEAAALVAVLFLLWLVGAAVYAPLARHTAAPLRVLLDEIRSSFYRKLFLFFVVAAIAPVLIFALAFGVYLTAKLRTEVETEAANVVTVARRVLEQTSTLGPRAHSLNDDVMVWIGQVLHQDVDLFEGPELLATSQRDLYASGLLPTRTPAKVYRAIALNRLPSFVGEEWLGALSYVVAAAPVPAAGRDFVLSVPLASRQREIEREIDELDRGVLIGAVFVILFAAGLGASVASRVSDPVARLSRATRQIAAGKLDVRLVAETADELSRLIEDFNSMAATLSAQRAELARANQLEAWAEMARQVAHEIKNPLTPIQLAAEHLEHVHADRGRPLGATFDQCVATVLRQVRLLRQIASEFSNFAGQPVPRCAAVPLDDLVAELTQPYRVGLGPRTRIEVDLASGLPPVWADLYAPHTGADQPGRERAAGDAGRRNAADCRRRVGRRGRDHDRGHGRGDGRGSRGACVRALLLDQDRRLGAGPGQRPAQYRDLRRIDRARQRARPGHDRHGDAGPIGLARRPRNRLHASPMNADDRYPYDSRRSVTRGEAKISAMSSVKTRSGMYERPHPKLIVLKLRNRIVLTISAAGTSMTATAASACQGAGSLNICLRSTGWLNG